MSKLNDQLIKQLENSSVNEKLKAHLLTKINASSNNKMLSFNDDGRICALIHDISNEITEDECSNKFITPNSVFPSDTVTDGCTTADIPDLSPTVSIRWGDASNDNMETSDDEVVCVKLCNNYSNVSFNNVKLGYVFFTDDDNIDVTPNGGLCFGDLAPCGSSNISCTSNQLSIVSKNCTAGVRFLLLYFCYDINMQRVGVDAFPFNFIPS